MYLHRDDVMRTSANLLIPTLFERGYIACWHACPAIMSALAGPVALSRPIALQKARMKPSLSTVGANLRQIAYWCVRCSTFPPTFADEVCA